MRFICAEPLLGPLMASTSTDIDWLIAGGESGPRHRPVDVDWVRDLRDRCQRRRRRLLLQAVGRSHTEGRWTTLDGLEWNQMPGAAQ